jgi:ankyrin repeat protein
MTPLAYAVGLGHVEVVRVLLKSRAKVNVHVADWSLDGMMSEVSKQGIMINGMYRKMRETTVSALGFASMIGEENIVRLLLQSGAKVNEGEWSPLNMASEAGRTGVVKLLLKAGARADYGGSTQFRESPLYYAACLGYYEIVKLLLEARATLAIEWHGESPLSTVAENGDVGIARLFLEHCVDVNFGGKNGNPPLVLASRRGHVEVVRLLLRAGANLETKDRKDLLSPIKLAAEGGHHEVVRLLIGAGADVNKERPWLVQYCEDVFGAQYCQGVFADKELERQ